jgi:solute carrier family 12 (potassium/chloride transporters), member 9
MIKALRNQVSLIKGSRDGDGDQSTVNIVENSSVDRLGVSYDSTAVTTVNNSMPSISDPIPIINPAFDMSSYHDLRAADQSNDPNAVKKSLRTLTGVFCPVALSMCSVAVFMRIGYIVGNLGFLQSIALYALTFLIFTVTAISVCAISTNGAIEGGGVYYMISRALGPEFGGAIGMLFFLANAIASAYNCSGLVEAVLNNFGASNFDSGRGLPESRGYRFLYGSIFNALSLIICLIGANLFSFCVFFIFIIMILVYCTVVISVLVQKPIEFNTLPGLENGTAMFTGLSSETFKNNLYANYSIDYTTGKMSSFASVFGVLFSSLTGIMAGANMSGELKNPAKSIPFGTLTAIGFVFIVYFSENILLAASCDHTLLVNDNQVMQSISIWGPLIPIGIVAATFSAELSNLIGASRILKALADDEIFGPALKIVKIGRTKFVSNSLI